MSLAPPALTNSIIKKPYELFNIINSYIIQSVKQKGIKVYINTSQFYSQEQDRYIKMYKILDSKRKMIINTASQIKALNALNTIWQEVKNNEERNR